MTQVPVSTPESNRFLKSVSGVMAAIGCTALAAMMCISVADVIGRKFFLHPIEGTSELVAFLLVIAASMGLGWCMLIKAHIRITIFSDRFSSRGQAIIDVFAYLMGIASVAIISWEAFFRMYKYMFMTLGSTTSILAMPIWPFMLVMLIGFIWFLAILIIQLVYSVKEVIKR
jgi:TRAP-type C4-dicarboxylate transport system permease small subunit